MLSTLGSCIGGISIIFGNWFVFNGDIYTSIKMFLIADIGWLLLAAGSANLFGIVTVSIGVILSVLVFIKMHKNHFFKTISKPQENNKNNVV